MSLYELYADVDSWFEGDEKDRTAEQMLDLVRSILASEGFDIEPCEICENRRYLVVTRSADNRKAIERCDNCVSDVLNDSQAAELARRNSVSCESEYPCYLIE